MRPAPYCPTRHELNLENFIHPTRKAPALHKHLVMRSACDQRAERKAKVSKVFCGCGWPLPLAHIVESQRKNIVIDHQTSTEKIAARGDSHFADAPALRITFRAYAVAGLGAKAK